MLVTGAVATLSFGALHLIVDTSTLRDGLPSVDRAARLLWLPLSWLGMNAIVLFICAEGGIIPWVLSRFYVDGNPDFNLANVLWPTGVLWGDEEEADGGWPLEPYHNGAVLAWTVGYISVWVLLALFLHTKRIYISI